MPLKRRAKCQHEVVDWQPVEVDHGADGTATVTQDGICIGCGRLVTLSYEPGDPYEPGERLSKGERGTRGGAQGK